MKIKLRKYEIITIVLLLLSAVVPYLSIDGRYFSPYRELESISTGLLVLFILNRFPTAINAGIGIGSLCVLAFFNSYASLCDMCFGDGMLSIFILLIFFAPYAFLSTIIYKSNNDISKIGTVVFAINALLYFLCISGHFEIIFDYSCIFRFVALFILWLKRDKIIPLYNAPTKLTEASKFDSIESELTSLKHLYEIGTITEQQYKEAKTAILKKL